MRGQFFATSVVLAFFLGDFTLENNAVAQDTRIQLSASHLKAAQRQRRIVVNYDINAMQTQVFGTDVPAWVKFRFAYADQAGSQIDTMLFCMDGGNIAHYQSKVLPVTDSPRLRIWLDQGIDIVRVAIEESRKRGLETFYSHRMNGSDRHHTGAPIRIPLKDQHPDWLIDGVWWEPGFWNYAVEGVRKHKLAVLRELAEDFDLDGVDLDFARTPPFFPIHKGWEHRHLMTEFMREVRRTFQAVAKKRGRPLLLSVRVAATVPGCHYDGLDIETWAREGLVDMMVLGTHSIDVDIAAFRRIVEGTHLQLYPCMDDAAHAPDGYRLPGIEVERGIFANWWQQGADGVATFNWANATPEHCAKIGWPPGPPSHGLAYREIGSPDTLRHKDKVFVVPRRFGGGWSIPWIIYTNVNVEAPLPVVAQGSLPAVLRLNVGDDLSQHAERVQQVALRVLLSGATESTAIDVKLNGILLTSAQVEDGGSRTYTTDPKQYALGPNLVYVRSEKQPVTIEKVEVHVAYR